VDCIKCLLDSGATMEYVTANIGTPLIEACKHGHLGAAIAFLERGCDVNSQNLENHTPLIAAALAGQVTLCFLPSCLAYSTRPLHGSNTHNPHDNDKETVIAR
jgi:ankyrin repeat protein